MKNVFVLTGFNEAALKDMLLDFHWLPAPGYFFVFLDIFQMNEKVLRGFLRYFALSHQIHEAESQTPMKLLLPFDSRNVILEEIINGRLKTSII